MTERRDKPSFASLFNRARAEADGFAALAGNRPASKTFRDGARARIVRLAAEGRLEVPIARTFPLSDALAAVEVIRGQHPGGKLALLS